MVTLLTDSFTKWGRCTDADIAHAKATALRIIAAADAIDEPVLTPVAPAPALPAHAQAMRHGNVPGLPPPAEEVPGTLHPSVPGTY